MSTDIKPNDFAEIRWKGHWIIVPEDQPAPSGPFPGAGRPQQTPKETQGLFRKTFTLARVPDRVPARMTADSRYLLFANGREVSRGPVRSQPRRLHYDMFDLAPYLQRGDNVLAVYVKYYGTAKSHWMPAPSAGTLGTTGVMVFEANLGDAGWLVSDTSWRAIKCDAWTEAPPGRGPGGGGVPVEIVDARKVPVGWEQPDLDDTAWGNAVLVAPAGLGSSRRSQPPSAPYGRMYPRSIAPLGGETCAPVTIQVDTLSGPIDLSAAAPATRVDTSIPAPIERSATGASLPVCVDIPTGGAVRLALDMGRIVAGFVQFEVEAPAGTVFDWAYVEDPMSGQPTGIFGPHAGTRYVARGQHDRFQVFDTNGLRYAYVLVHGTTGPVTLNAFSVREHLYPWTGDAGFECSDAELNAIYRAGIRTVQLNSHDAFLDCPTREQRAWVGDAVVHQMVSLATNADWRLAWHYVFLGNSPRADGILPMSVASDTEARDDRTIPDWSLHWVHGVYNLYRFAGDRAQLLTFLPTIARVLRWYAAYQNADGLLKDLTEWNLVDWAAISVEDTTGVITALWARSLREFAEMAGWLGENASRAWAEETYAKVKAGFEAFWDEARGSYVDHIVDGVRRPEMSQLGGALAILSELAPPERWRRIVDTITNADALVETSWVRAATPEAAQRKREQQMKGIYAPDWDVETEVVLVQPFMQYVVHDAVAEAGMAGRLPTLYRRWHRFLESGYDTIGECWSYGTHVHAWSCTPTRDMAFYTLGVTPDEPGYTAARIAPRLGDLAWAKGSVPTPHGPIRVHVTAGKGVTIDSPVPLILDLEGQAPQPLPAGHHEIKIG